MLKEEALERQQWATKSTKLQEAIYQARMVGAWNSMVWRAHWNDKSRRDVDPDDDPDRVLIASVRSMCLAAQACILAYFAGAYALAGEDIAVQAGLPHKVHDRYNHLKAGPGATGDPETRPDMPLGHYRFERGYLIGFQDNSDGGSIEWAICEKIKFGPRPIRVRVLGSNEVKRISIDDIRYVQRNISSQYAQCTLVTTNSDDPGTAGTGNLECRRKSIIAAIIFAATSFLAIIMAVHDAMSSHIRARCNGSAARSSCPQLVCMAYGWSICTQIIT